MRSSRCLLRSATLGFAREHLAHLVGRHKQAPPAYSAIKRNGVKAYEAARAGKIIELQPRDIEIYAAELLGLETDPAADVLYWDVRLSVSKGTYIRSIARDTGVALGTAAHVATLRRVVVGPLNVADCLPLGVLEQRGIDAAIDPVYLLGYRMAFLTDEQAATVRNGQKASPRAVTLFDAPRHVDESDCGPRRAAHPNPAPLAPGELVSLVHENCLVALYEASAQVTALAPRCVFSQGVTRGKGFKVGEGFNHALLSGASCAFGVFDGVHKGHQFLIGEAKRTAAENGGASVALTFDIDPDERFHADRLKKP